MAWHGEGLWFASGSIVCKEDCTDEKLHFCQTYLKWKSGIWQPGILKLRVRLGGDVSKVHTIPLWKLMRRGPLSAIQMFSSFLGESNRKFGGGCSLLILSA